MQEHVAPIEACSWDKIIIELNCTKNRTLVMCALSNINKMAYFYAACAVCITIFCTGSKFRPFSNLRSYMLLILAAHFYLLLDKVDDDDNRNSKLVLWQKWQQEDLHYSTEVHFNALISYSCV